MNGINMSKFKTLSNLPLSFEANIGQKDEQVKFIARGGGYTAFFTKTEVVLTLLQGKDENNKLDEQKDSKYSKMNAFSKTLNYKYSAIKLKMEESNPDAEIIAEGILEGKLNYFIGNDPEKWITDVPIYTKIKYKELYPGIDVVYYAKNGNLEHDYIVKPGANPRKINLSFEGAEKTEVDEDGNLIVYVGTGKLKFQRPIVYQDVNGTQQKVDGRYEIRNMGKIGLLLGEYDSNKQLKIDPVMVYSTFLGGNGNDYGSRIAVDSVGNAYVTGYTYSSNFPTTLEAYDTTFNGTYDVFVTKLNAEGTRLVYSTFFGGSSSENGVGIALDASNNVYVTGSTKSSDFPTTADAYGKTFNGNQDAFVTKLNAHGTKLVYSTFLGGSNYDNGLGIKVDAAGNAYVTGHTSSSNFPTTTGAYDTNFKGFYDIFITKLNANGTGLIYSTFIGGSSADFSWEIALDAACNAYITGHTYSNDFPTTAGAYDTNFNGTYDAFVTKLNACGTGLIYSTFLGGSSDDNGLGIAVDVAGNAYVTGSTYSSDFPTTAGAYDTNFNGINTDAFVTKLNAYGTGLVYSTFLGGSNDDESFGIAVDATGNAYVTGYTYSSDFPTTAGAYDTTLNGVYDVFVTKLNAYGTGLIYSTFIGGSNVNDALGIALDTSGNVYVTGFTSSDDFPTTAGAYDTTFNGANDVFITKLNCNYQPTVPDYSLTTFEDISISGTVIATDYDGDTLIYSLLSRAHHGTAVVNPDGSWTYTPHSNYFGTDSFSVKVEDGNGGIALSTINITIIAAPVSPTITIISPNGGEVWREGTKHKIEWTVTGKPERIRIDLIKNGILVYTIAERKSKGFIKKCKYNWKIPSDLPSGSDYRIRITSIVYSSCTDTSDNQFTIQTSLRFLEF